MSKHSKDTPSFMFFALNVVIKEKLFDEIDSNASNSEIWFDERIYFDEKFVREQTSSNCIKTRFFLLFYFFRNYGSSQMRQTFHQTREVHGV